MFASSVQQNKSPIPCVNTQNFDESWNIQVFLLTTGGMDGPHQSDPRKNCINKAIDFAVSARLAGVVSHSSPVLADTSTVKRAHQKNLLIFTYGHPKSVLQYFYLWKEFQRPFWRVIVMIQNVYINRRNWVSTQWSVIRWYGNIM